MCSPLNEAKGLLNDFFPSEYEYKVVSHLIAEQSVQNFKFDIELRVNVDSREGLNKFLSQLNQSTQCTFNIQSGRQDKTQSGDNPRSSYRGFRKCCLNVSHSNDKENQQPGKNTKCEASINFRIETPRAKSKSEREDKEQFPLWMKIHFHHNHALNRAE